LAVPGLPPPLRHSRSTLQKFQSSFVDTELEDGNRLEPFSRHNSEGQTIHNVCIPTEERTTFKFTFQPGRFFQRERTQKTTERSRFSFLFCPRLGIISRFSCFPCPPPCCVQKAGVESRRCTAAWFLGTNKPSRNNKNKKRKIQGRPPRGVSKMSRHIC
ncbi:unnamed protein product, partial [Ectocarpus sp. 12 AP-2014]